MIKNLTHNDNINIVIDLVHPSDVNFFKNAANILKNDYNADLNIFVLPRGNLIPILKKEFCEYKFKSIGNYRTSFVGKALGTSERCIQMLNSLRRYKFDVATGFGGIGISHISYVLNRPSVIFEDDIEYALGFYPYKPFASRIVMPRQINIKGKNIIKYDGFKELAYLHPNYFTPSKKILDDYGIKPMRYVFIREVSNTTLNYSDLNVGKLQDVCSHLNDMGFDIVASLEDDLLKKQFKDKCIILKEPVQDIYSLLSFASLTISSGDTMSRESCLLGTPAIYTGGRLMSINKELQEKSCLFKIDDSHQILDTVRKIMDGDIKKDVSRRMEVAIKTEWEDTTEVILDNLLSAAYRDDSYINKYLER